MSENRKVYIALPVLNESVNLYGFIDCMRKQDTEITEIVVCVNNYNHWWENDDKVDQCIDNQKSIEYLNSIVDLEITIIDRASKDLGWPVKKGGVGWARKIAMDQIASYANNDDLIVCMDADTFYPENYISSLIKSFGENADLDAISIPYYHKLRHDDTDKLILRYEIYMRCYLINLLKIQNPYAFTALGSAMAVTIRAYRKTGGLTPVKSGEDFYFLQKIVKIGKLGLWTNTVAYPSSRLSDRVLFGTGPALIKGNMGDWDSYPIYHRKSFDEIEKTFGLFKSLFVNDLQTPMDEFLANVFKNQNIWLPFRQNYKDVKNFEKACIGKVDGLRLLQFLRNQQENIGLSNEECLVEFLENYFDDTATKEYLVQNQDFSFTNSSLESLINLRDLLFEKEMILRKT